MPDTRCAAEITRTLAMVCLCKKKVQLLKKISFERQVIVKQIKIMIYLVNVF